MATPADQRLLELLEKWLKSLELHLRYSSLDGDSYLQVQPWPEHQRPSRWIIELAMQKARALRAQVEERIKMGDAKFSDSLELMTFLANLLGSEHIERFIPLADPATERAPTLAAPDRARASGTRCRHRHPRNADCRVRDARNARIRRDQAPLGTGRVPQPSRVRSAKAPAAPKRRRKPRPNHLVELPRRRSLPTAAKPAGGGEARREAREAPASRSSPTRRAWCSGAASGLSSPSSLRVWRTARRCRKCDVY